MSFFPAIRLCNFRFIIKGKILSISADKLSPDFRFCANLGLQSRGKFNSAHFSGRTFFLACDFAIFGYTIFAGELFAALLCFRLGSSRHGEMLPIFLGQTFAAFGVCRPRFAQGANAAHLASRIFAASGYNNNTNNNNNQQHEQPNNNQTTTKPPNNNQTTTKQQPKTTKTATTKQQNPPQSVCVCVRLKPL